MATSMRQLLHSSTVASRHFLIFGAFRSKRGAYLPPQIGPRIVTLRPPARGATAFLMLAALTLTACSTDSAPDAIARPSESMQSPTGPEVKFVAPDRSSNAAFGLTADGPERFDSSGAYRQAAIADDSPVFQFSPEVVYEEVRDAFSAEEIAMAQRAAATFVIREYIDSELVADSSEPTRTALVERMREQVSEDSTWDPSLADLVAGSQCGHLIDCRSATRTDLGYTLTPGTDLRFILTSFLTTGVWLDNGLVIVAMTASYKRELDVPGFEHAFESSGVDITYSLENRDGWFINGFHTQTTDDGVRAFVEGGLEALPEYSGVDWGTIPPGYTEHDFQGVHFAVGPEWARGGDERWTWTGAASDESIDFDSYLGPVLNVTGSPADLAVVLEPEDTEDGTPETTDPDASYPINGAAYRLQIPGTRGARAEISAAADGRDRIDIEMTLTAGDKAVWFVTYAEPGEAEARLQDLVQTITIP